MVTQLVPQALFPASATPPHARLDMPTQVLNETPVVAFPPASLRVTFGRLIVFGGGAILTVVGYLQMTLVFGNEFRSVLEWLLLLLFTASFGWIALSATQALAGLLSAAARHHIGTGTPLRGKTAIVMPVYNEDPAETCASLYAMAEGIAALGEGRNVEIFILSDTRDPAVWLRETAGFHWLRRSLSSRMAVWYRRRHRNSARKAGNLRQFVETWGGRYDYMLVLDADSLLAPDTIVEMIRRMEAAPKLGILQTVPMLSGGATLFARLQQFGGCLYGRIIARGVDVWQGNDGNYWGHNALIRVSAFAAHCGLPELPGRSPFGGHVLSHDFVEAALIRRGGWQVRIDPDLAGSWEGPPPSLLDLAGRDRRWAQGNLQHVKVLGAKGLRVPNRVHFLMGIGAYLMAPIWLLLLLVGGTLTAQTLFVHPRYFSEGLQLFPEWPVFDATRMAWLLAFAMVLLLFPRMLGLVRALALPHVRQSLDGPLRIVPSAVLEVVLSALYAPILMVVQVRHVVEIVMGLDSGWSSQQRKGAALPWRTAVARHKWHVAFGLVPLVVVAWLVPEQVVWLAPVLAGLIFSPVLSRISGSTALGAGLLRLGLLVTPEERAEPSVYKARRNALTSLAFVRALDLVDVAENDVLLQEHCDSLGEDSGCDLDQVERLAVITARAKIEASESFGQAVSWMTTAERTAVVGSAELLRLLVADMYRTSDRMAERDERLA